MKLSTRLFQDIARRRKKGFTLVETLVVMTIFSIIVTMLFTVFRIGLESWRRAESNLEIYQNARIALDMMGRELRAAMLDPSYLDVIQSPPVPFITFRGFDSSSPSGWRANSTGDEIYFVASLNPQSPSAKFDLCEAGYWLNGNGTADTRDDSLQRFYDPPIGASPPVYNFSNGNSSKLASYVAELNFRYHDGAGFSDTWNSTTGSQAGKLPKMVEITLTVRERNPINPNNPNTERFRTNIFIPRSQK